MPLLDEHARQLEKFRRAEEVKQRRMAMEEERRRQIEMKHHGDKVKIDRKQSLLADKSFRAHQRDVIRAEKVALQNEHDKLTSDFKAREIAEQDRQLENKLQEEQRRLKKEIATNEAIRAHNMALAEKRRLKMEEEMRQRVLAKHKADEQKLVNKALHLSAEQQRLHDADAARCARVERAQLEEELRVVRKVEELEAKDAALRAHMEEEQRLLKHMQAVQAAERASAQARLERQRQQLEEFKRQKTEAKLKADEQKLLNKQHRLRMEKERLRQQDAERQATTMKAMLEEEERKLRLLAEIESKDAALQAQMQAEAAEQKALQKESDAAHKRHQQAIEARRKDLERLKRERTEAKLDADKVKEVNKRELLELEKQRLNLANSIKEMKVDKANTEFKQRKDEEARRVDEEDRRDKELKALKAMEKRKSDLFKVRMKQELEQQTTRLKELHQWNAKSELPQRLEAEGGRARRNSYGRSVAGSVAGSVRSTPNASPTRRIRPATASGTPGGKQRYPAPGRQPSFATNDTLSARKNKLLGFI
uniref:Uncharacterized protein n=1 Tax=Pyramimonas obovata TaxID=1411642 RepID=A0A7S0RID6_9CHLO|mmetsp:Transcript_34775/g.76035  ORF Transcript_34775/g.76035 Transcript_34775/m.76035 type:complete len:537 (+) Transcript_34775:216-1826(+)|eukprot:CAMPEP_0118923234 /NCGR_PEP_ID=MMETSP1169-20130426/1837_1 /TAXON_ID=36882 /ORGANISM="Pyramimonas obovata, Strain CCMP722" /LENGTH=536 /DNA_ID=CAMNT_0006864201 /DNA_START=200 /DNA_END=1810 /DNA_ORIENTATION=-